MHVPVFFDRVRVIDEKYLASKLRFNEQKLHARWSKRIYTIRTVKSANSDTGFMPEYILTISGNDDEYRSDPVLKALAGHDRARASQPGPGTIKLRRRYSNAESGQSVRQDCCIKIQAYIAIRGVLQKPTTGENRF